MRSFSIPLFASLLVAGCGVLFETRAEVVSYPRATALVRVESSAHGVEGVVTAAAPPVLPGFEARVPSAGGTVLRGTDSAGSVGAGGPGPWVATEPAESGTVAATPAERPATAPRDGVWSLDGRPASLAMLLDGGVQVDGTSVRFADLLPFAGLDLGGGSGRLATDGSLEAWAELEHEALPRSGGETHLVVRVRGAEGPIAGSRAPVRLHLVIDASSSMQRSWSDMLDATRRVVGELRAEDELQIVAYGSDAVEVLPLGRVGDGRAARAALSTISVGGGTHIEAGLRLAYGAVREGDLVVLFSDGVPNHGAFDSAELGALARVAATHQGTTTCAVGLGSGFDAQVLRRIATEGGGSYHVATDLEALALDLVAAMEVHARSVATHVELRFRPGSGTEIVEAAEAGAAVRLVPGGARLEVPALRPGEERRLVLTLRVAASASAVDVGQVELAYRGRTGAVRTHAELGVSMGSEPVLRSGAAVASALLDRHLAAALDAVAAAAIEGDAIAAERALTDHASLLEGRLEHPTSPALRARARVTQRLGVAVAALIPQASPAERQRLALELGPIAATFER